MKILVIEDDEAFSALVQAALETQHYQVDRVTDAQSGWDWLDAYEYDLILLDLVLPGEADGLCFCRELRAKGNLTPVLLMTANEAQSIKVQGLDAGADDYLVKPFDWDELLARVRALLRRGQDALSPLLVWGVLELDPSNCEVVCQAGPSPSGAMDEPKLLSLTAKEYSLLELLLRNPHRIFNASALLDRLWDSNEAPSENAVRAHIKGLRRKLKLAKVGDPVETVYGLGYRLRESPQVEVQPEASLQSEPAQAEQSAVVGQSTPMLFQQQLEQVWRRARKTYLEQVTVLDDIVVRGQQQSERASLSLWAPEDWNQMRRQAHSLKGGLGSFGLHGAASVAAQLQNLVEPVSCLSGDGGNRPGSGELTPSRQELLGLLAQLRQALEAAVTLQLAPLEAESPQPVGQCWIATTDTQLAERLMAIATPQGITIDLLAPEDSLEQCLLPREDGLSAGGGALPQLVLWDLATVQDGLGERLEGLPWVALIERDSLAQRVQAAQEGSCCCVDREGDRDFILDVLSNQLERLQQKPLRAAKLLVVDDDTALLDLLEGLLQPLGAQLTLLSEPESFWKVLQQTQPDLLLLDVEMPGINGVDLCRVVRQDPKWCRLPILFISARRDGPLLEQLFAAGANGFLRKPLMGELLLARVRACLEQFPRQDSSARLGAARADGGAPQMPLP